MCYICVCVSERERRTICVHTCTYAYTHTFTLYTVGCRPECMYSVFTSCAICQLPRVQLKIELVQLHLRHTENTVHVSEIITQQNCQLIVQLRTRLLQYGTSQLAPRPIKSTLPTIGYATTKRQTLEQAINLRVNILCKQSRELVWRWCRRETE